MRTLLALLAVSVAAMPLTAQNATPPAAPASPAVAMGNAPTTPVISPEVHSDGTVTLRYEAPSAKAVSVVIEGQAKPFPMTLNSNNGVWEFTTPAMPPEYYGYTFSVDDKRQFDPHNPLVRPNLISPTTVMHIPSNPPQPWELTDIPHGEVHHHWYQSKLANDDRDFWVYTPPSFDPKRKEKYPVLYLNHGFSDAANGWIEAGQANLIFDSLLHDGKIKPMVVVMARGYGDMQMVNVGWGHAGVELQMRNQETFADQLLHEVMPMVEAEYNLARDPAHRAIAGLSMGGGHSLYTGLNHPEVFQYVGAFSAGINAPGANVRAATTSQADIDAAFGRLVPQGATKTPIKLLWMSCGTEDGLITVNHAFEAWAKTNIKGNVQVRDTPGMHTWMVWRDDLIAFTPLLFQ